MDEYIYIIIINKSTLNINKYEERNEINMIRAKHSSGT